MFLLISMEKPAFDMVSWMWRKEARTFPFTGDGRWRHVEGPVSWALRKLSGHLGPTVWGKSVLPKPSTEGWFSEAEKISRKPRVAESWNTSICMQPWEGRSCLKARILAALGALAFSAQRPKRSPVRQESLVENAAGSRQRGWRWEKGGKSRKDQLTCHSLDNMQEGGGHRGEE